MDDNSHGTHVAGTIGAVGDNNLGVVGVSPNVSIMSLKFLDDRNGGSTSNAVEAIEYATNYTDGTSGLVVDDNLIQNVLT